MHPTPATALRAGDVVVCGRRFFIVVADSRKPAQSLGSVLVRCGPLDRLRSHVLPSIDDLRGAGLPLRDTVVCCDRVRPLPAGVAIRLGTAPADLLRQIATTLERTAAALAAEASAPVRCTIWREPGGDRGRQVGAKSVC
ncbi:hypothetical protein HN018_06795 [Lichenicola cladoniae]|uniref:Uncharacterized protein n=1 Tax=Lichenicola cladoniae TaxID=1484109 RepID=A0A6M8HN25_9PROT|nr:hypothetical protein [Lichenicola cladoniae]NPD67280.1 hypothetical protein [Acetobacteraceae bacterium]QKE89784.1 hypothetical protein HN018_06795 [Lichenicola cladoniae]